MEFHIDRAQIYFDIDLLPYYLKPLRITKAGSSGRAV